ncbi:FlgO family outer membrane protein [Desulfogranum japonicum]|uniref:FlgO family outer membrane protein n=1 Tax=Desulfogranum japonicum TaxID=231447 RepID=UPI000421AC2A|nr:FlgO family outer membrane protein [Desulfogranum japonicum]
MRKVTFFPTCFVPVLLVIFFACISGCSRLNGTRLEPVLGGHVNLVALGDTIARKLIAQCLPPLFPREHEQPVLVTTPVDEKTLKQATDFGRSLQNSIIAGFVTRTYTAKELKLRGELVILDQQGEFMLTRELEKLAQKQKAQALVLATYTLTNRVLYLSVRLVDPNDRTIRAAYEDKLYLDDNTLRMLGYQFEEEKIEDGITPPRESFIDRIFY